MVSDVHCEQVSVSASPIFNILLWVMCNRWMVLYCISFRFVLVVMETMFLLIWVQKSGLKGLRGAKSFSHFLTGSHMKVTDVDINIYDLEFFIFYFFESLMYMISLLSLDGYIV